MSFLELQYIDRLAFELRDFKLVKQNASWNFKCPYCEEDSKKRKSRGYILTYKDGSRYFYCHLGCEGKSFKNFLKDKFPSLHEEFVADLLGGDNKTAYIPLETPKTPLETPQNDIWEHLTAVDALDTPNPVSDALSARKIPLKHWNLLYYCNRFKEFSNLINPDIFTSLKKDCPRLGIPFFDKNGKPFLFSFRAFDNAEPKYMHIKVAGTDHPKIYGLERVDWSKTVYVCEGPLDSLFLPNALAVGGGYFLQDVIMEHKDNVVIVPDNEPRKSQTIKNIEKTINAGFKVVVYPHYRTEKDLNDMIMGGMTEETLLAEIEDNTFSGLDLKFRFAEWNKC